MEKTATLHFDANRMVPMDGKTVEAMVRWCNRSEGDAQKMLSAFREEIATECSFETRGPGSRSYAVVFTSGASEANSFIVTSAVRSYAARTGRLPHVVASAVEHRSLLECCRALVAEKLCQLTVLPVEQVGPDIGTVSCEVLKKAIRPNTCLVTVMAVNGDTGMISNLRALSAVAKAASVPFHTDAAQLFGRSALRPTAHGIDAFSVSFHKIGGPPGVGALVLRRALIEGYGLVAQISGEEQNEGLRGGAENIPGLGASYAAFRYAMTDRAARGARVQRHRDAVWAGLAAQLPCFPVVDHPADRPPSIDGGITPAAERPYEGSAEARRALSAAKKNGTPVIFWVAPRETNRIMPNTLLLAVRKKGFSGRAAQAALEKRGVAVGAPDAGVGVALGLPAALHKCLLRVSLSDGTSAEDVKNLVHLLHAVFTLK